MGRILILKEAAYGSREEPPTMTRLMQGNYPEKPEACTICGNSPVVAGAQFRNRLGNINYTHHLCEPCADQYDIMHSADTYKGEPIDIAMRLLKQSLELQPPMTQGFEEEMPMQEDIPMVETMDYNNCDCAEIIRNVVIQHEIENIRNGKGHQDIVDYFKRVSCEEIQQMDFYEEAARMYCGGLSEADQMKYASEPMDIAMRLLKDQDAMKEAFDLGHELIPYDELHDKQRAVVDMITNNQSKSYWNDPVSGEYETEIHTNMFRPETHHLYPDEAYDEYMRYLQHFYAASAETNNLPHEEQVKIMRHYTDYGEEHPLHPDEIARQKMADEYEHWNSDDPHGDFYNRYSEQPYNQPESFESNFQQKNASEPMDIAMQLLKRDLSEMTDYEIDRARFANDNPELQSEERTRAMDRMAEFSRQNVTPFDYGDEVEEAYDDIGDQDHSDYFGEDIDPNELYQYILENAGQEAAQNYVQQYKDARAKYGGNAATMGQLDNYGISNQGDANDFIESRERMTGDMRNIMPNDETVFDAYPYPEGVSYNNKLSPPFTTTPQNESNFQMKYTGEPMDIAMRLLKNIDQEYLDYLDEQIYETSPYHSIRLQPSNYNSPHLARPLANYENLSFQQSFNDRGLGTKLPLTSHGRVLEGRHVYPAHAFSINPSLTGSAIADIPRSYMGEDYYDYPRPLNLFGFTGNKTPQRDDREARNVQSEGIIYGDIPEENVVQLTDNPFFYDNLRQASKSLLPTQKLQPSMLNERQQELARLLMEHEIPPVLMDEHIPTELIDDAEVVNNSRDTYRQWSPQRQLMDDMDLIFASEPMDIALRLLKRQTTLSAFDKQQIQENLKPQNSNIFIAAKPGKEETRPGELSQLSDNMLAELAALKEKHGEFGITSATGNAGWELEPSFMLTNVPQSARGEIHAIAEKYRQHSIAVSEQDETGAKFLDSQGNVTYTDGQEDSFRTMEMDPNAEYSTDFPTGQRLTFKSEPMEIAMQLLKERVSPEAKRHKLEYDKKYESSPERVKYREELNRERRRRHIMGQGGPDMSHTSQHTIVPEDPHTNRARHFKEKGTLL